jgi:hypothetical protein
MLTQAQKRLRSTSLQGGLSHTSAQVSPIH